MAAWKQKDFSLMCQRLSFADIHSAVHFNQECLFASKKDSSAMGAYLSVGALMRVLENGCLYTVLIVCIVCTLSSSLVLTNLFMSPALAFTRMYSMVSASPLLAAPIISSSKILVKNIQSAAGYNSLYCHSGT